MADQLVYFTAEGARRIAAQVIARERSPKNGPAKRGDYGRGHLAYGCGAMTPAGGIPAATGGGLTPGNAVCALYDFDPTTGGYVAAGRSETVYNCGGAIVGSKFIQVDYKQGVPFADVVPC